MLRHAAFLSVVFFFHGCGGAPTPSPTVAIGSHPPTRLYNLADPEAALSEATSADLPLVRLQLAMLSALGSDLERDERIDRALGFVSNGCAHNRVAGETSPRCMESRWRFAYTLARELADQPALAALTRDYAAIAGSVGREPAMRTRYIVHHGMSGPEGLSQTLAAWTTLSRYLTLTSSAADSELGQGLDGCPLPPLIGGRIADASAACELDRSRMHVTVATDQTQKAINTVAFASRAYSVLLQSNEPLARALRPAVLRIGERVATSRLRGAFAAPPVGPELDFRADDGPRSMLRLTDESVSFVIHPSIAWSDTPTVEGWYERRAVSDATWGDMEDHLIARFARDTPVENHVESPTPSRVLLVLDHSTHPSRTLDVLRRVLASPCPTERCENLSVIWAEGNRVHHFNPTHRPVSSDEIRAQLLLHVTARAASLRGESIAAQSPDGYFAGLSLPPRSSRHGYLVTIKADANANAEIFRRAVSTISEAARFFRIDGEPAVAVPTTPDDRLLSSCRGRLCSYIRARIDRTEAGKPKLVLVHVITPGELGGFGFLDDLGLSQPTLEQTSPGPRGETWTAQSEGLRSLEIESAGDRIDRIRVVLAYPAGERWEWTPVASSAH